VSSSARNRTEQVAAIVVGGGPAGLMAAEALADQGVKVLVCDAMPSLGRKFLRAGVGGLNLTHIEPKNQFSLRYQGSVPMTDLLRVFDADTMRAWAQGLGIETFVGSSGRVFPVQFKASPLLRAWLKRLQSKQVLIRTRYRWQGWEQRADGQLHSFESPTGPVEICSKVSVLALGGGSWARLGSDGWWFNLLQSMGIDCQPLGPSNCGFQYDWSDVFRGRFAGTPLKSVALAVASESGAIDWRAGEAMVTAYGMEGGLVYALSAALRDELKNRSEALLLWDLVPNKSLQEVRDELSRPRGKMSLSSCLRKRLGLPAIKISLLRELIPDQLTDIDLLAAGIKKLPMHVHCQRPLDEAISTAGGINGSELTPDLMLKRFAGVFCAGEMLDWDAPTGGYLLTAAMASGHIAGIGAQQYLQQTAAGSRM